MHRLLDALYLLVLLLASPWLLYRAWRTGRVPPGFRARLRGLDASVGRTHGRGLVSRRVAGRDPRPACPGARVSPAPSRSPVRHLVHDRYRTRRGEELFPDLVVFPFPFDFSWACRRTLDRLCPSLVVLTESEMWPNFLRLARQRHIPSRSINGRMSPRSLSRYATLAPLVRPMLAGLDLVCMQTDEYAAAMLSLGALPGRVVTTGNIKYDGAITDRDNAKTQNLAALFGVKPDDLVWIAGSTCEPEEQIVVDVYRRAVQQHPRLRVDRGAAPAGSFRGGCKLFESREIPFVRRSTLTKASEVPAEGRAPVILVDTIGELNAVWGLASVAYVGGSLDGKRGGQNMIEPAAYGAAVVFGPHVWNFKDTASRLTAAGGAYQVSSAAELSEAVLRLLADASERQVIGQLAGKFVLSQQGATQRTVDRLGRLLSGEGQERAA